MKMEARKKVMKNKTKLYVEKNASWQHLDDSR